MELEKRVYEIAEKYLPDETYFMVDVIIKATKGPKKVLVLIDCDQGVNIDVCADVSRKVGAELEEDEVFF
ncbi:ribosome maturation factor RimP [Fulvivirga ligni]|uniref:ribosome maturation factor RimP n=1 Tax=Fulvivirga ligni TaxID=2904246 RepID=UPI001F1FD157|nr:hypothetical protein [Fulvivirga ligni]UII21920.1 hypothetical protein LVD16_01560 [Fulvivirga ligni]